VYITLHVAVDAPSSPAEGGIPSSAVEEYAVGMAFYAKLIPALYYYSIWLFRPHRRNPAPASAGFHTRVWSGHPSGGGVHIEGCTCSPPIGWGGVAQVWRGAGLCAKLNGVHMVNHCGCPDSKLCKETHRRRYDSKQTPEPVYTSNRRITRAA